MAIRYHLDEHIDPAVSAGLKGRGIDVTTTNEAGLLGADDDDHLRFALAEMRAIMTHDEDFLVLHSQGRPHYGIVILPPRITHNRTDCEVARAN